MVAVGKGEGQKPFMVLTIDELTRIAPGGAIERYYRHRIRTRSGVVLTVDIDEGDFTAVKAEPILRARAAEADAIKGL